MKKNIFIILILFLISGCSKENTVDSLSFINKQLVFEYGDTIHYSDIVDIINGELINDDEIVYENTGDLEVYIPYIDTNGNIKRHKVIIYLNDTIAPLFNISSNLYVLKNGKIDICGRAFFGDIADRNLDCYVDGIYDIEKVGSYKLTVNVTDDFMNTSSKNVVLNVVNKISENKNTYQTIDDPIDDMINKFKTDETEIGIDVSTFQGDIDWQAVKDSGVEFAILRIGYGHNSKRELNLDNKFENNIKGAKSVGLKVGVYFYSSATEFYEVDEQTEFILEHLKGYDLELPIAFDFESWGGFQNYGINFLDMNKVYLRFKSNLEQEGFEVMNYGSKYYLNNIWNTDNFTTWLAHYGYSTNYENDYYIWQFTDTGIVPGIKGHVDLDILYKNKK